MTKNGLICLKIKNDENGGKIFWLSAGEGKKIIDKVRFRISVKKNYKQVNILKQCGLSKC